MPLVRMRLGERAHQAGQTVERLAHVGTRHLGRRALFLLINLLVAAIVTALPFIGGVAARPAPQASLFSASVGSTTLADTATLVGRAVPQARGQTISAGRDPRSQKEPVLLPGGFRLRGSIDLVERHTVRGVLRVTDHKTGKPPAAIPLYADRLIE